MRVCVCIYRVLYCIESYILSSQKHFAKGKIGLARTIECYPKVKLPFKTTFNPISNEISLR